MQKALLTAAYPWLCICDEPQSITSRLHPVKKHTGVSHYVRHMLCSLADDVQSRLHKRNAHRAAQRVEGAAAADADQPVEMLPEVEQAEQAEASKEDAAGSSTSNLVVGGQLGAPFKVRIRSCYLQPVFALQCCYLCNTSSPQRLSYCETCHVLPAVCMLWLFACLWTREQK